MSLALSVPSNRTVPSNGSVALFDRQGPLTSPSCFLFPSVMSLITQGHICFLMPLSSIFSHNSFSFSPLLRLTHAVYPPVGLSIVLSACFTVVYSAGHSVASNGQLANRFVSYSIGQMMKPEAWSFSCSMNC